LSNDVENLLLTGSAASNGAGNGLSNSITGNGAANLLSGGSGNDAISGGLGGDTLSGGLGRDSMRGGAGADIFSFDKGLGAANVDNILDFSVRDDTIALDRAIFRGIVSDGALIRSAFHSGAAAHDEDDRIIYDRATGSILYDRDGTGAAEAVLFATVTPELALTSADFIGYT
jgi:serralysin